MISKTLLLVEQIRPGTPQIDDLRTAVPILLEARALEAVERIADALAAAHDAFVLVVAERALVADAHQGRRAHVGIAHGAFAIAFVAEPADRDARLLAAHDEVGVMAGHGVRSGRDGSWTGNGEGEGEGDGAREGRGSGTEGAG